MRNAVRSGNWYLALVRTDPCQGLASCTMRIPPSPGGNNTIIAEKTSAKPRAAPGNRSGKREPWRSLHP